MRKKFLVVLMASTISMSTLAGCSKASEKPAETTTEATKESETGSSEEEDQAAAKKTADLIDAIYVQKRTSETDAQCEAAKASWDALTDAQKELVSGVHADFDYFGRDTGDASKDDALNQDGIGENELLVVSFGTSFNDTRTSDIGGIEKALIEAYPDWSVRRAFTAQIIINHIQARENVKIDNVEQALDRAVANGVKNLVIQPTHLMRGSEFDDLIAAVQSYQDQFETVKVAQPLLGEVGADATVINEDKEAVAKAITAEAVKAAGYESLEASAKDGVAFVFMGHGSSHTAAVSYNQMQTQVDTLGYENVFIGTVDGEPEDTSCEAVIEKVKEAGYKKVILRPLMVVAGDHANNDMAGEDEESWKGKFEASKEFDSVDTQIEGLGRVPEIKDIYVAHTKAAMEGVELKASSNRVDVKDLEDGEYQADFKTDSSMFKVNEACNGKGVLTVKDGKMTLHVSLTSKNIVNLFPGFAEDAQKDGAVILQPTNDTVTYSDGTTANVNGFDVPVNGLNEEFDLALLGNKGKWYDHKVSVSNPTKIVIEGSYTADVTLTGGSGKTTVESPAKIEEKDGQIFATIVLSSKNYDYMIVNDQKILNEAAVGEKSTFTFPIPGFDVDVPVVGNTTAMGNPHEIEYTLKFTKGE